MTKNTVYHYQDLNLNLEQVAEREEPRNILICNPSAFDVKDSKNVHMENNVGKVDKALALEQWNGIHEIYIKLKQNKQLVDISVIENTADCEDMA